MGTTWDALERFLLAIQEEYSPNDQQVPMMSVTNEPIYTDGSCTPMSMDVTYSDPLHFPSATPVNFADATETSATRSEDGASTLLNLDYESKRSIKVDHDTPLYSNDPSFSAGKCYDVNRNVTDEDVVPAVRNNIKVEPFLYESYSSLLDQRADEFPRDDGVPVGKQLEACIQTLLNSNIDLQAINVQDVQLTSSHLGIPEDPMNWSNDDVFEWISLQCRQFLVPLPKMDYFYITGRQLCSLSEEEFKEFAPGAGETLYSLLFIWRNVVDQISPESRVGRSYLPPLSHIPVPRSPTLPSPVSVVSDQDDWDKHVQKEQISRRLNTSSPGDDTLPAEPTNHHRQTIQLWQFLRLLLVDPSGNFRDCIKWVDRSKGIFKIENSSRVAKLWGKRKNRPAMNYDKLSRSIRQYYKKGIIKKTEQSKRLVYQFCKP